MNSRRFTLFVIAELVLALSIPFIAIQGFHTLVGSKAGTFVDEAQRNEPGWRAQVSPSEITAVVQVSNKEVNNITLLTRHEDLENDGGVIVVPGNIVLAGKPLAELKPVEAVSALGQLLRLKISSQIVVNSQTWNDALVRKKYRVVNPDVLVNLAGQQALPAGQIEIDRNSISSYLAANSDVNLELQRRVDAWAQLLADPPEGEGELVVKITEIAEVMPQTNVVALPPQQQNVAEAAIGDEKVVRETVSFASGPLPGDRIQLRLLGRAANLDLEEMALGLAANGIEVVEIGNVTEFDSGQTHLVIPTQLLEAPEPVRTELKNLSLAIDSENVVQSDTEEDQVVTLVVGSDFEMGRLRS